MGFEITRNGQGLYRIEDSVSGGCYHPDSQWVTTDEAKKILINDAFTDFVDRVFKIDMDFPRGYTVNDRRVPFHEYDKKKATGTQNYMDWAVEKHTSEEYEKKFEELYDRLKLTFKI
jgi:NAD+--asparagine ADP-ribosyltransferase